MSVQLTSTNAKVNDPQTVRKILDSYALRGVDIELCEEGSGGTLKMAFQEGDPDWWAWPLALHRDQWPDEEQYPDEDQFDEDELGEDEDELGETEWGKRYEEKGEEGFLALLRDLAPCLETPLMLLVVGKDHFTSFYSAQAWTVHPGSKNVETLDVSL
jgi:hypothetical protein